RAKAGLPVWRADSLEFDVRAADPPGSRYKGARHRLCGARGVKRELARNQSLAFSGRVYPADEAAASEQGHRVVAVYALGLRDVGLQAVIETEHALRALAVPDQRVERGEQRHAMPPCLRGQVGGGTQVRDRGRIGPRMKGCAAAIPDRYRDEASCERG